MMTDTQARQLAEDWVAAWNRRDLDAVLAHYAEDVSRQSLPALQKLGLPEAHVTGKEQVRAYFRRDLDLAVVNDKHLVTVYRAYYGSMSA